MARGDAVLLTHTDGATGYETIVPASGDEYFIMRVNPSHAYVQFSMTPDSGTNWHIMRGSGNNTNAHTAGWTHSEVQWYLTPTCYIRLYSSSEREWTFTAVKSKD